MTARERIATIRAMELSRYLLSSLLLVPLAACSAPASRSSFELPPEWSTIAARDTASGTSPSVAPASAHAPTLEAIPVPYQSSDWSPPKGPRWQKGQPAMQGFIGVSFFDNVSVEGDGGGEIDGDEGDLDQLPLIGGGAQFKLGGERIDFGLEGMLSFSGRANTEAFAIGGGGVVVAVDVDLMIFELFGGPFASMFLGESVRVYAGAGPVLQWVSYDQSGNNLDADGDGFGSGLYARTGFEFTIGHGTMLGLGVRWSDTTVDLGGGLGDLEIDGIQGVLTVTTGI